MVLSNLVLYTSAVADFLWSSFAVILLLGTGLFFTFKTRFVQVRALGRAISLLGKENGGDGEVSSWQALATSLGGTVGAGNITGVASAIALGGPGAVFWMWVSAFLGMATTFGSCSLAVGFREKSSKGQIVGGPMYVLKNALGMNKLAVIFVFCTVFATIGSGNMIPANALIGSLTYVIPEVKEYTVMVGLIATLLVALPVLGGVKRISHVLAYVVPFMCFGYLAAVFLVLASHWQNIPEAFAVIFKNAFNLDAAGGGFLGAAIQYGVARGLFSNEAGQGSLPIIHSVAKTNAPEQQGLIAMLGPFIDTVLICTLTALTIIVVGAYGDTLPAGLGGSQVALYAFDESLGHAGLLCVCISLLFFAYSTIVAWAYYGEAAVLYLTENHQYILGYRLLYTAMVFVGVCLELKLVWNICDIAMVFMMLPNLIAILLLRDKVKLYAQKV